MRAFGACESPGPWHGLCLLFPRASMRWRAPGCSAPPGAPSNPLPPARPAGECGGRHGETNHLAGNISCRSGVGAPRARSVPAALRSCPPTGPRHRGRGPSPARSGRRFRRSAIGAPGNRFPGPFAVEPGPQSERDAGGRGRAIRTGRVGRRSTLSGLVMTHANDLRKVRRGTGEHAASPTPGRASRVPPGGAGEMRVAARSSRRRAR